MYEWLYDNNEIFEECPWFLSQVPPETKLIILHEMPMGFDYTRLDFLRNFMPHEIFVTNKETGKVESKIIRPQYIITTRFAPNMPVEDFIKHRKNGVIQK